MSKKIKGVKAPSKISEELPDGVEILPVCFFLYNFVMKNDI